MPSLDIKLRFVTPAFVAGATGPEADTRLNHRGRKPRLHPIGPHGDGLRVPTLRGILRFWFRAKEGIRNTRELARREARIFGSTARGQGVRIVPTGQAHWKPQTVTGPAGSAKTYLGYGPIGPVARGQEFSSHNRFAFRDAMPAGTELSFKAIGTSAQLDELRRSLLLLHFFGGLGARSRRCWGSVEVVEPVVAGPTEGETIAHWIERALRTEVWPDERDRPGARTEELAYSGFCSASRARLFESEGPAGYEAVMRRFFERFGDVRTGDDALFRIDDADTAQETLRRGRLAAAPQRIAFGLPYEIRFRDRSSVRYSGAGRNDEQAPWTAVDRRASPLFLKVLPVPARGLAGIALFLKCSFLGFDEVKITAERCQGRADFPGYAAVTAFLEGLPDESKDDAWQPISFP